MGVEEGWCKVNLNVKDNGNAELKKHYPSVYNYLIPKIKSGDLKQIDTPTNVPEESRTKLSKGKLVIRWLGILLAAVTMFIVAVHMIPTVCLAACICVPLVYCLDGNIEGENAT